MSLKKLGICAPSARFDIKKFNSGIHVLETLGFHIDIPSEIFATKRYLAGEDFLRARVINRHFSDPAIDGIICARGGFGAIRILDYLDWDIIRDNPKPLIGFSDSTALLMTIMSKTKQVVIHGPTVTSFSDAHKKTIDSFYNTVQGKIENIELSNGKSIKPGKGTGILVGGNMATLSHLLGTRYQPEFRDAVLFLEDIGEPAYKIDRMLTQMKMAGVFKEIKGVITGSFKKCENEDYISEIVFETFDEYDVPILAGLDAGHGRINLSLYMGTAVILDADASKITWI
ncbi:MAG: LD-carboxypeptidase [Desulfobacula sp.]|nr:LD-carboxypeptidase [Desulfobacula sp.]